MREVNTVKKGWERSPAGKYGRCSSVRAPALKHNIHQPTDRFRIPAGESRLSPLTPGTSERVVRAHGRACCLAHDTSSPQELSLQPLPCLDDCHARYCRTRSTMTCHPAGLRGTVVTARRAFWLEESAKEGGAKKRARAASKIVTSDRCWRDVGKVANALHPPYATRLCFVRFEKLGTSHAPLRLDGLRCEIFDLRLVAPSTILDTSHCVKKILSGI